MLLMLERLINFARPIVAVDDVSLQKHMKTPLVLHQWVTGHPEMQMC